MTIHHQFSIYCEINNSLKISKVLKINNKNFIKIISHKISFHNIYHFIQSPY